MPQVAGVSVLSQAQFYATQTVAMESLGELHFSQVGQGFRFAKAGAVALVIGNLLQAAAQVTNFKDMAVQAAVATTVAPDGRGGYPIPVTLGGTSTTANQFAGGQLTISSSNGIGQTFTIVSHDVATNGTTCNFYVLEQPLVALTTSSKASVIKNLFDSVIQMPTTHTGRAVGGAVTAIPIANYGYVQTLGAGSVLSDATVTAATTMSMSPSVTTAGAGTLQVAGDVPIGDSIYTVTVSAEAQPIWWKCF